MEVDVDGESVNVHLRIMVHPANTVSFTFTIINTLKVIRKLIHLYQIELFSSWMFFLPHIFATKKSEKLLTIFLYFIAIFVINFNITLVISSAEITCIYVDVTSGTFKTCNYA